MGYLIRIVYPFTAPAAIPLIRYFCAISRKIKVGTVATLDAAISAGQSLVNCITNFCRPIVMVCTPSVRKKMLAKVYSPHALIKVKIPTVEIPGIEIGSTTLKKAVNWLQPSIMAASSMSNGIVSKKPTTLWHAAKGNRLPMVHLQ